MLRVARFLSVPLLLLAIALGVLALLALSLSLPAGRTALGQQSDIILSPGWNLISLSLVLRPEARADGGPYCIRCKDCQP